ncbi:MAG TPA: glucan biosynthesis protein G [Nevskiaceae bacterium]|nr:glucan biosynthesis protein G [Nevskiaceae bacterium]
MPSTRRGTQRFKRLRSLCAASAVAVLLFGSTAHAAFSFATVEAKAKALSSQPYQAPADSLSPQLAALTHAQYQQIHYAPSARLWAKSGSLFSVGFLARASLYHDDVRINEVDAGGVHPITFNGADFTSGSLKLEPKALDKAGFSGLVIYFRPPAAHHRKGRTPPPPQNDKVLVFQGASFFHGLVAGQPAGASARGLAVDTGLLSGEEFPQFTEFWIERPASSDKAMVIDALMDSKRTTGAFRFALYPGKDTRVEVTARIFLRNYVTILGIAPLNSMYLYGENDPVHGRDDYRPEVHNSDGLQIHSGTGEWLWRPLVNPARMLITSFSMTNPQGFGLMQRDRHFRDYEDLSARYGERPSVWVTPEGNWGAGRVELVMLPTPDQTHDNIFAFWVPDTPPPLHQPLDLSYRIEWQGTDQTRPPSAWVTQTRVGDGFNGAKPGAKNFVVDFDGPALAKLPTTAPVNSVVSVNGNGEVLSRRVVHNPVTGGWRMFLSVKRVDDHKPVELRAYLRNGNNTVSETWSYILPPV